MVWLETTFHMRRVHIIVASGCIVAAVIALVPGGNTLATFLSLATNLLWIKAESQ